MKRGEIYRVKGCHPCVLLEDGPYYCDNVNAIAFTHCKDGGTNVQNSKVEKDCFVIDDPKDKKLFNGTDTYMMNCAFDKDTAMLFNDGTDGGVIGRVKEECLRKLELRVRSLIRFEDNVRELDNYIKKHKEERDKIMKRL